MDGMTAIVAGAGPGIGRACAAALRQEGADVVVAARDAARLEAMAAEMPAQPSRPGPGRAPGVRLRRPGLLPGAGGADPGPPRPDRRPGQRGDRRRRDTRPIDEGEWESWRRAFEVNVIGTMELSRLAARAMRASPRRLHHPDRDHRDAGAPAGPGPLHGDEERHGHRLPHPGQGARPRPRPGQRGDAGLHDGRAARRHDRSPSPPAPARAPTRCPPAWPPARRCGATSTRRTSPRRSSSWPVPARATSPAIELPVTAGR